MRFKTLVVVLLSFFWMTESSVFGQNKAANNVGLLSESQLNDFWSNAQRLGYDLNKVMELLQEGGYSYTEALTITDRIREMEVATSGDPYSVLSTLAFDRLTAYEKKIYGLKLFYQDDFQFADVNSVATPEHYVLGKGDALTVVLYGETDTNYTLVLDELGRVSLPFEGPFSLAGLELDAAESLIKQKLGNQHAGLKGATPTVFMDMTLSNARSIKLTILGEVMKPGTVAVPSTTTVFNALYDAGGPTTNGTLRRIKVFRNNKLVKEVDLYEFISRGLIDKEFWLQDEDVVVVSTYTKRIELIGAVKNPGIYELRGDEKGTLMDALNFAGGFSVAADTVAFTLRRLNGASQLITQVSSDMKTSELQDGDVLQIGKLMDFNIQRIQISGAVNKPGFYAWTPNLNLQELINLAGGLRSDALGNRASLFTLIDGVIPKLKSIQSDSNIFQDIEIEERSTVYIPSKIYLEETKSIPVTGQVNVEGSVPFYEGMTLLDALVFSEGITRAALEGSVEIVRQRSLDEESGYDYYQIKIPKTLDKIEEFLLTERDRVFVRDNTIRSKERTVEIKGDVAQPGKFIINQGKTRISDLEERFGSFLSTANLNGLKLYRKVTSVDDKQDSSDYRRKETMANFISDPRFEGTVSTLQYDQINKQFAKLENDRILLGKEGDPLGNLNNSNDSISVLNDFKLSKDFVIDDEKVQLLEMGISYEEIQIDPNSHYNLVLLDGDIIFVPSKSSLVEVDGHVFRPTQSIYKNEKTFLEYVETAGGFKRRADKRRAYVEYANGEIARVRSFLFFKFYPAMDTDARIVVPEKPARTPFSIDRVFALLTTTVTTYLLIEAVTAN